MMKIEQQNLVKNEKPLDSTTLLGSASELSWKLISQSHSSSGAHPQHSRSSQTKLEAIHLLQSLMKWSSAHSTPGAALVNSLAEGSNRYPQGLSDSTPQSSSWEPVFLALWSQQELHWSTTGHSQLEATPCRLSLKQQMSTLEWPFWVLTVRIWVENELTMGDSIFIFEGKIFKTGSKILYHATPHTPFTLKSLLSTLWDKGSACKESTHCE